MPDLPITDIGHDQPDSSRLLAPGTERRQSLRGFDPDYVDIVDYIVRGTHQIWEDGGIGRIYNNYQHNVVIHTSDGLTYGRDKVIADSLRTLSAFPDIRLFADDVIWSGNDMDGFYTSHRVGWVGHNTGHSNYGPPTGRRVMRYGAALCYVKDNHIIEEWICRDELALIRQLGFDEHALARQLAEQDVDLGLRLAAPVGRGEVARLAGQSTPAVLASKPTGGGFDVEDFTRRAFHDLWNWRLLNRINELYASNYVCRTSSNRSLQGRGDYKAYVLGFMAAFPDLALDIDHICWVGDDERGYRVATRWTLHGTHRGPGVWGKPSGQRIRLLGITHQLLQNGQFTREWTCFDEFALLKQFYAPLA